MGAGEILLTSMDKDGTKSGFDLEILSKANEILKIRKKSRPAWQGFKKLSDKKTIRNTLLQIDSYDSLIL